MEAEKKNVCTFLCLKLSQNILESSPENIPLNIHCIVHYCVYWRYRSLVSPWKPLVLYLICKNYRKKEDNKIPLLCYYVKQNSKTGTHRSKGNQMEKAADGRWKNPTSKSLVWPLEVAVGGGAQRPLCPHSLRASAMVRLSGRKKQS